MPEPQRLHAAGLDIPTLFFVAVCLAALLGLFLIFAWIKERDVRPLAWWGTAYLIGASAMALWTAPAPWLPLPSEISGALIFIACGMMWNGVRLFHGRRLVPLGFAGALVWLALSHMPVIARSTNGLSLLGAALVAFYTFGVAFELWRERRKSHYSRVAAVVVPMLHGAIFLAPIAMKVFLPRNISAGWVEIFALETIIYAVGTAFIVLLMVKDHHVHVQKTAASTDPLTGLCNRRAFLEAAKRLCALHAKRAEPVTVMMFDLDYFKSINDRFGHSTGDEALKSFAATVRVSMRSDDVIGRLGGEEFAAIVPGTQEIAVKIAERVRAGFEETGSVIAGHVIGGTVSIGAACALAGSADLEQLLARADVALYRAKTEGRNRICFAEEMPPQGPARLIAAARAQSAVQPDGELVVLHPRLLRKRALNG